MNRESILFFVKIPPPITGATVINKIVIESELLRKAFSIRVLSVCYTNNARQLGKFKIRKIVVFLSTCFKIIWENIFNKPLVVYFQISLNGLAFIRDFIYVLILKVFRVHVLFHIHGQGIQKGLEKKIIGSLYRYVFRAESIICLSERLASDLDGLSPLSLYILPNGIPSVNIESVKSNKAKINLLFISNLFESKGIFILLEAVKAIVEKGEYANEILLNIIGDEGDINKKQLDNYIKTHNLTNLVNYLGVKFNYEKRAYIQKSDIFIHPTMNDAFPLVILEAMDAGLPIISTIEGGIPDMIDQYKNGILVSKGCVDELVLAIEYLISNKEKRDELGKNAQEKFNKHFTEDIFTLNLSLIFKETVKLIK